MFYTALIMGFAGSLHCVAMCSPLAMAVSNVSKHAIINRLIYNFGRILTYGILGSAIGTIGELFPLEKFANVFSIGLGVALLVVAASGAKAIRIPYFTQFLHRFSRILKNIFADNIRQRNYKAIFIMGTLNGLLPCGLTFLALLYSITLGSPVNGFFYMLAFGVGTLPVMIGLTTAAHTIISKLDINLSKMTTILLVASGCLLIARVFIFHQSHPGLEEQTMVDIILCR